MVRIGGNDEVETLSRPAKIGVLTGVSLDACLSVAVWLEVLPVVRQFGSWELFLLGS